MNAPLIFGGLALAGLYLSRSRTGTPSVPGSNPKGQTTPVANTTPFKQAVPPRVDNANQPWYVGGQAFNPPTTIQNVSGDIKAGSSVIHSLTSVWGDVSSFFGGSSSGDPHTPSPTSVIQSSDDFDPYYDDPAAANMTAGGDSYDPYYDDVAAESGIGSDTWYDE